MLKSSFKLVLLAILLLAFWPFNVHGAQPVKSDSVKFKGRDLWLAPDKGLHFLGSMMVTVAGAKTMEQQFAWPKSKSCNWAIGFSVSLGIGKELRDASRKNNFFSWKDLVADCLGTAFGRLLLEIH